MTAYYNEIDPYAAQWLRNLIEAGHIAPGEVDTRSIIDVRPDELAGFEQCHFFAGLGGWSGALRLAGVADTVPLWTGSCPCQPFSLAGKQKGFADERHLWPVWRELIRKRRPAKVFGEQVASATEWLGLVRSDLEAMGYAMGAMPIQAASAGADHLRDRYWFVGHDTSERRGERRPEYAVRKRSGPASTGTSGIYVADAECAGSLPGTHPGIHCEQEGSGTWHVDAERYSSPRPDLADADQSGYGEERQQRSREQCGPGCHPEACAMGDGASVAQREQDDQGNAVANGGEARSVSGSPGDHLEWVIGADGKARRVKPGIRLLAHGVPARVAKLRALGNAIDLRPAAAFIGAAMSTLSLSPADRGTP